MAYSIKIERKIGRVNSKPCASCKAPLNKRVLYSHTAKYFGEGYINCNRHNICAKCNYKANRSLKRTVERYQQAMQGNCSMMKAKEHTWSDGTLTGGKCQYMCTECNLNCAFGEKGSF